MLLVLSKVWLCSSWHVVCWLPSAAGLLCAGGNLVINPFDPNASKQQWIISERKIQNRHNPNVVIEARTEDSCRLTSGEYSGSDLQLWNISHVYVSLMHW